MTVGAKYFALSAMRKLLGIAIFGLALLPSFAFAQLDSDSSGLNATGREVYGSAAETNIAAFIGNNILQPALGLVGIIFFVLVIYAGFLWMTAGGNSDQVSKAKNILVSVVVGAVIISLAYIITDTVFDALSGGGPPTDEAPTP